MYKWLKIRYCFHISFKYVEFYLRLASPFHITKIKRLTDKDTYDLSEIQSFLVVLQTKKDKKAKKKWRKKLEEKLNFHRNYVHGTFCSLRTFCLSREFSQNWNVSLLAISERFFPLMTMFLSSARNICKFTQLDIIFLSICR